VTNTSSLQPESCWASQSRQERVPTGGCRWQFSPINPGKDGFILHRQRFRGTFRKCRRVRFPHKRSFFWLNVPVRGTVARERDGVAACENSVTTSSPVGTVEASPGRSPGLAYPMDKSRRDDWQVLDTWTGFGPRAGKISRWKPCGSMRTKIQSSLRDFSPLESLPRTTSWAKFSRPFGTHLVPTFTL
jgi:hypothetical protein